MMNSTEIMMMHVTPRFRRCGCGHAEPSDGQHHQDQTSAGAEPDAVTVHPQAVGVEVWFSSSGVYMQALRIVCMCVLQVYAWFYRHRHDFTGFDNFLQV